MTVVSVVLPTYNEAATVGQVLAGLQEALVGIDAEFIVVDDDSRDGTADVARAACPQAQVIVRTQERGLATAVVRGLQEASGAYVVVMDADMQHPPEAVLRMLQRAQERNGDLVVGSRFAPGGSQADFPVHRRIISGAAAGLARIVLPPLRLHRLTDPMSGLFLVRRDAVPVDALRPTGYKILLEIIGRADLRRIEEVGYVFGQRGGGESKLGGAVIWHYLLHLAALAAIHPENRRLFRFALVGLSGIVVNFAVLLFLKERLGWSALGAAAVSVEAAILWNFLLNDRITFPDRRSKPWRLRILDFHVVSAAGYVTNLGILWLAIEQAGLDYRIGELIAIGVAFLVNYVGNLLWTYRRPEPVPRPAVAGIPARSMDELLSAVGPVDGDLVRPEPWGKQLEWFRSEGVALACLVVDPGQTAPGVAASHGEVIRTLAGHGEDAAADPPFELRPGRTYILARGQRADLRNVGDAPLVVLSLSLGGPATVPAKGGEEE